MEFKHLAKSLRNRAVSAIAPHRWSKARGSLLVLTYHRVLPKNFPDAGIVEPGMYVSEQTFAHHLEFLRNDFEMVDLADWIKRRQDGTGIPERACAITFDDGWRDNYEYAFPLLRKHGVPATIFVVAGMVGTMRQFWPERLARLLVRLDGHFPDGKTGGDQWLAGLLRRSEADKGKPDPDQISSVIHAAKRFTEDEIYSRLSEIEAQMPVASDYRELLDWTELHEMVDSGLVSVGSHTVNHVRLTGSTPTDVLEEEVVKSKSLLQERLQTDVSLFCYPNGDSSEAAETLVRKNYLGACTTQRGWNGPRQDQFSFRRYTMHEGNSSDSAALLARISGWV